ncbi:MAG: C39 family peptidase [Parcubacteria group bacterium]|nr:C39 family peptidase [Parcubacteria group bacterium]
MTKKTILFTFLTAFFITLAILGGIVLLGFPEEVDLVVTRLPMSKDVERVFEAIKEEISFPEKVSEVKEEPLPTKFITDVPFTSQAPFAEWSDSRQQEGCEEASITMAAYWAMGKDLTLEQAKKEILAISAFEEDYLGTYLDASAEDTVRVFKEYYKNNNIRTEYNFSIEDIKKELVNGNLVIVPTNGQVLDNPYYNPPGPIRHMIVIKGYDDETSEFITNDPGTRQGDGFRFKYSILMQAIINYGTGYHVPPTDNRNVMIVVGK